MITALVIAECSTGSAPASSAAGMNLRVRRAA
jgi:hypothetical protein